MRARSGTGSAPGADDLLGGPAPALVRRIEIDGLHHRGRVVARRDHERDTQRELVARLVHRLLVFDLHQDALARPDIGDRIGEHVGALLLHQGGLAALRFRLRVDRLGGLALLHVGHDDALAHHHLEGVDRPALGQRIDIDRLDPVVGGVMEKLGDACARGRAAHVEVDVGGDQRRLGVALAVEAQQQRAGARFAGRHADRHRPGGRRRGVRTRQDGQNCRNRQQTEDDELDRDGGRPAGDREQFVCIVCTWSMCPRHQRHGSMGRNSHDVPSCTRQPSAARGPGCRRVRASPRASCSGLFGKAPPTCALPNPVRCGYVRNCAVSDLFAFSSANRIITELGPARVQQY